jgi:hypothetical protein
LVDTRDLKSLDLTVVPVRFRPQAPLDNKDLAHFGLGLFYCLFISSRHIVDSRLKDICEFFEGNQAVLTSKGRFISYGAFDVVVDYYYYISFKDENDLTIKPRLEKTWGGVNLIAHFKLCIISKY